MSGFSESSTVQAWMVERLVALGWTHIPGDDLLRSNMDVLVESDVESALLRLNREIAEEPGLAQEALPQVRAAIMAGASEALVPANERMTAMLRGEHTLRYAGEDSNSTLHLLDFGGPDDLRMGIAPAGNTYVVSDEVTFGVPGHERRYDMVLFVNGIPLVVIETKSPINPNVSWFNAAKDLVNVYTVAAPQFFVPNVLMVGTDGNEYRYGAVGQPPQSWALWGSTKDPFDLKGMERVQRSIETQLTPASVLSILRDFSLFLTGAAGQKRKLLPRYPQVEAALAILDKALTGRPGGLIWHYQGTGKTLLQAYAAGLLLRDERVGGPTIVCVVDRLELFEQTSAEFTAAGVPRLEIAQSKAHLRDLLRQDFRGVIMTTIHRFDREDKDAPPQVLNERRNIIVTVDEAHRTTEGSLGDDMRAALPNAVFFGMTGTPIADKDRNTFTLFGDPNDPDYVMSKYEPERSMADGATVPVRVETRPVDFKLDSDTLDEQFEEFLDEQDGSDGRRDLTEAERKFLTDKAANVKTAMANPARIDAVCDDIVLHFIDHVIPLGMKAMVVAYDRELVVKYADAIKARFAERGLNYEVAVVMNVTSGKDEPPEFKPYALTADQEKAVKNRFRDFDDPLKIVVVTAKLITGFDAPILYAQYLDRPLRRVTLFQAITRPNRNWTHPISGKAKKAGLVIDYIGLGEDIAKALNPDDPDTSKTQMMGVDDMLAEFASRLDATFERFAGLDTSSATFESLQDAMDRIPIGDKRDQFAKDFIGLEAIWDTLYPHPELLVFRDRYKWLAQVYQAVQPNKGGFDVLWERLGDKTLALVHEHMTDVSVTHDTEQITLGPDHIQQLRDLTLDIDITPADPETDVITLEDAFDMIDRRIKKRFEASGAAVYKTLAERLELLRAQALEKAGDSIEWIKKALDLATTMTTVEHLESEGNLAEAERLVDPNIGALSQIVSTYAPENVPVIIEDLVRDIDKIVNDVRFTGWNHDSSGDREVRKAIRKVLKDYHLPITGDLFDKTYAYVAENY